LSGPIGLHGGGEYQTGDEPFLDALLTAAAAGALDRSVSERHVAGRGAGLAEAPTPVRIVILPTAAARGQPMLAAANGHRAFRRRAEAIDLDIEIETAPVVDATSAADPATAAILAAADLIHLPGGDPDLIATVLQDSPALAAIRAAFERGAVVAGASAGAMALADWTWTARGGVRGLGLVRGLAVVPHYDDVRRSSWQETLDRLAPGGIGYLGLDERTGVISEPSAASSSDGTIWRVAGAGSVYWFARGESAPIVAGSGAEIRLPG
jgi:cyanophycinase-like exopeptidase